MKKKVCIVLDEELLNEIQNRNLNLSKLINKLLADFLNNESKINKLEKEIEVLIKRIEDLEERVFANL